MIAQKLFKDIPGGGKYHSCILSSFSFDYHFFDQQIRRYLHGKGIYNIILLCDAGMLDQNFGLFSFGTRYLSSDYTITAIKSNAVFHPKVSVFFGDHQALMHLGSGNLTSGGMGKNHELFSTFSTDQKEGAQYEIIKTGANYLYGFLKGKSGFVQQQLKWIRQYCSLIDDFETPEFGKTFPLGEGMQISCLANSVTGSIYEQFKTLVPTSEIESIKIVSPYFDKDGYFLRRLSQDYPGAKIDLLIQTDQSLLPEIFDWTDQFSLLDWSTTPRAISKQDFKHSKRFNHSKIFVFNSKDKIYLLHGSANATAPGFGLRRTNNNDEIALLFEFEDDQLLSDIGLDTEVKVDLASIAPKNTLPPPERKDSIRKTKVQILGADKYHTNIHVFLSEKLPDDLKLVFLNGKGNVLQEEIEVDYTLKEIRLSFVDHPDLMHAVAICLYRGDAKVGTISLINEVNFLYKSNPNRENRKLQKILSNIQIGNIDEFSMFSHLHTIFKNAYDEKNQTAKTSQKKSNPSVSKKKTHSYEETKRMAELDHFRHHPLASARDTMEALNMLFRHIKNINEDKAIDQEEAGAKSDGGDTAPSIPVYKEKQFKEIAAFDKSKEKVLDQFHKYLIYLDTIVMQEKHEISLPDLCFFLIIYYQLLHITEKRYTIHSEEDITEGIIIPLEGRMEDEDSFYSLSIEILGYFLNYLQIFPFKNFEDEYTKKELASYKKQCALLVYYSLVIQAQSWTEHLDWYAVLWNNTEKALAGFDRKDLLELSEAIQKDRATGLPKVKLKYLEMLIARSKNIDEELTSDIQDQNFIFIKKYGVFKVLEKIPHNHPKALKLCFPGIYYDEGLEDFFYPEMYLVATNSLVTRMGMREETETI